MVQTVRNPPADAGDTGSIPQLEILEKGMATHSSILAWELPRTEEPGGLQSIRLNYQHFRFLLVFQTTKDVPLFLYQSDSS